MALNSLIVLISLLAISSALHTKPKQSNDCCEEYCYELDTSRTQYGHFSSKTPYSFVRGTDTEQYTIPGCEAEKIWILNRHGTRLPSTASMQFLRQLQGLRDEIVNIYDNNQTFPEKGGLCNEDLDLIRNWKWDQNILDEYDEYLTPEGWDEVKLLAQDYKAAFPQLVGNTYSADRFIFRYTDFQRSEESFKAFAEGLFGDGAYNSISLPPQPNPDLLLLPYEYCETYRQNVAFHNSPDGVLARFRNTEIYRKFRNDLSQRLGIDLSATEPLDDSFINSIWEMCRFDKNWNIYESSPWCAALTESHVKILEYYEDLFYYYRTSYGFEPNSRIACFSMQDMLHHLEGNNSTKIVAYFAHIAIVNFHLTAMGALRDSEAITGDNYDRMENRNYRNREITFNSNLAAVKYHCHDDPSAMYKVKFFLNQKPLELDYCPNGWCKYEDVLEKYGLFRNAECSNIYCSDAVKFRIRSLHSLIVISFLSVFKIFVY